MSGLITAADQSPGGSSIAPFPLVSIVVPCYDGELFLEETLRSALAQSYPAVEVIVVDDGSTDGSAEIARQFPVRYLRQENRGLSEARNTGIRMSQGAYLVFLDADDRLLPDAIACGMDALAANPDCAVAVGDHCFIESGGARLRSSGKAQPDRGHYEALLRSNFIEMISSVLFRRSVFEHVGTFDRTLRVAEDYDLYLRIARMQAICCHPEVVAEYRMHAGNISHNSELMLSTTLQVLGRQAVYVGDDARRRVAFRQGQRSWRRQYGRRLALELATSFSNLRPDDRRHKLRTLARCYPQGLFFLGPLFLMAGLTRLRGAIMSSASRRDDSSTPHVASEMFEAD